MRIKNTTRAMAEDRAEQLALLADGLATGSPERFITDQEKQGQRELVNSDRLPVDRRGRDDAFLALGFRFDAPDPDDPLFCRATLPAGWTREASTHDMWSHLLDQHGRKRVTVFYKAAFYDRKAFMRLEDVEQYVVMHVEYDGPLVITDEWATRDEVIAAMVKLRDDHIRESVSFARYAMQEDRPERDRQSCRTFSEERFATAARYTAALARLEPEMHVVYCRGCQHAWITGPWWGEDGCACTCTDDTSPSYEDWVTDPSPADVPPGSFA